MRKAISMMLLVVMLVATVSTTAQAAHKPGWFEAKKDNVPVRDGKGDKNTIVSRLNTGEVVYIVTIERRDPPWNMNEWGKTSSGRWIFMDNLTAHKHSYTSTFVSEPHPHELVGVCRCGVKSILGTNPMPNCIICNPQPPDGGGSGSGTTSNGIGYGIVNVGVGDILFVRSGPSREYNNFAYLSHGERIKLLEQTSNGWYKIELPLGAEGYVSGDYVQKVANESVTTTGTTTSKPLSKEAQEMSDMVRRSSYNRRPLSEFTYAMEIANTQLIGINVKMVEALTEVIRNMLNGLTNTHLKSEWGFIKELALVLTPVPDRVFSILPSLGTLYSFYEYAARTTSIPISDINDIAFLTTIYQSTSDVNLRQAIENVMGTDYSKSGSVMLDLLEDGVLSILEGGAVVTELISKGVFGELTKLWSLATMVPRANIDTAYSIAAMQVLKEAIWQNYGEIISEVNNEGMMIQARAYYGFLWYLVSEQYLHAATILNTVNPFELNYSSSWTDSRYRADIDRIYDISYPTDYAR